MPAERRGTAKVEELGFDLEKMMRFVRLSFAPPARGGRTEVVMPYMGCTRELDGAILQAPLSDEHEERLLTTYCRAIGYEIDWNGWRAG